MKQIRRERTYVNYFMSQLRRTPIHVSVHERGAEKWWQIGYKETTWESHTHQYLSFADDK